MAKGTRVRAGRRNALRKVRRAPYPSRIKANNFRKNCSNIKKDWEDATCAVCMENPHNAVLLLCSSHDKGCRPYMCGTSFRHSNCLDQYKKAYTKLIGCDEDPFIDPFSNLAIDEKLKHATKLACPLCRGQVMGWAVVDPAREHLNAKKRNCMQDNCSFVGTYRELKKHVRAEHPSAKPREVDPTLEQKWRGMEREREREDVMSTIRSSVPGAVFYGDYVIEGNNRYGLDSDDEDGFEVFEDRNGRGGVMDRDFMSVFLFLQAFGSAGNMRRRERDVLRVPHPSDFVDSDENEENDDDDDDDDDDDGGEGNYGTSLAARLRRQGSVVMGGSGRRRRRREAGNGRADGFN